MGTEAVAPKAFAKKETLATAIVPAEALAEARAKALRLPAIELNSRGASDLLLLASGGFSPLDGFTDFQTSSSIVQDMRLPGGAIWPFPILLQTGEPSVQSLRSGTEVVLKYQGHNLGFLKVEEAFAIPLRDWAKDTTPTLESHLQEAEKLAPQVGASTPSTATMGKDNTGMSAQSH